MNANHLYFTFQGDTDVKKSKINVDRCVRIKGPRSQCKWNNWFCSVHICVYSQNKVKWYNKTWNRYSSTCKVWFDQSHISCLWSVFTSPSRRQCVLLRCLHIKTPGIKQHSAKTLTAAQELIEYKLVQHMLWCGTHTHTDVDILCACRLRKANKVTTHFSSFAVFKDKFSSIATWVLFMYFCPLFLSVMSTFSSLSRLSEPLFES